MTEHNSIDDELLQADPGVDVSGTDSRAPAAADDAPESHGELEDPASDDAKISNQAAPGVEHEGNASADPSAGVNIPPIGTGTEASQEPNQAAPGDDPATPESEQKDTGQLAAAEDGQREAARAETNEKAEKAESEGGATPQPVGSPSPVYAEENRQDRIVVAGHQYRDGEDVEIDPAYSFDLEEAKEAPTVDHIAVAADTNSLYLVIDGTVRRLDVNLALALNRLVAAGAVALNY